VVALILFLLFRNGRDVLLPLASVSLALIWTLGFIAMTGLALSILTMIVPVFLIAVGTAYCLHIVSEYRHQSIRNPSPETATLATFSTIAFPTVLAAGTTILGLGSLFVSRIFAIKTFALFACGGMVSFVVIILTFLPATLSLMPLPRPAGGVGKQRPTLVQRLIDAIVSLNLDHRRVTLPLFAALILVCIFGMLRLEVETNPVDYFRKDAQVRRHFDDIHQRLTGFGVVISASSQQLTIGQVKSLSITMVVIFGIMLVLFLSYKVGLVAIIPNFFPIVVNFGIMGWLGIELSMATSLIASVAIGLAVDDTIHYMVRFNREFRIDLNEKRALETTLSHIGRPIIYTTVTIGIGFSILMFSSFSPTAVFGAMMVITMFSPPWSVI
jgi:predicted RND superfamily exporter protein